MLIGRWKNYEELEESLSLPELMALYSEHRTYEQRQMLRMAKAQGADIEIEDGPRQPEKPAGDEAFMGILNRIGAQPSPEKDEKKALQRMKIRVKGD